MAAPRPPTVRSMPDWSSGLPPGLLEIIGKRVASGTDAASLRSVCTPWRDVVPFAAFSPLLLLPFGPASGHLPLYSVTAETAFSVTLSPDARGNVSCGASCGWLALVDVSAAVTLLNPFTGARVNLPPADEHVAESSEMFVSKEDGWWMLPPDDDYGDDDDARAITLGEMREVFFHEIVLSAPPDADGRGCVAMAVLPLSTEVAFCRVGVDSSWTLLETNLECSVDSVLHCKGRFLAIDCAGQISICGNIATPGAPTATPVPSLSPPEELCNRSYLEVNGELYVVGAMAIEFRRGQMRFDYNTLVYRCSNLLDPTSAWTMVNDTGGLTLSVSNHFRHSFGGTSVSRFKRNSVYFSDPLCRNQYEAHCLEIADIATGTSKVTKPFYPKVKGFDALGWIRPNLWRGPRGDVSNGVMENPQEVAPPEG